ncbi:hypothetical protein JL721_3957 [Aureococcus anophagefferens]|nr:hypothetical protein JL721_3957 [Aureococcus anophagefferens]
MNKVILFLAAVGVAAALPACSGPDSTSFKLGKGASKLKCADFLASKKKCNKKGKDRGVKIKASLACPQACGACCGDSEEFFYGAKKKGKTCAALGAKEPGPREKVCKKKKGKKIDVKAKEASRAPRRATPEACGAPDETPTAAPTAAAANTTNTTAPAGAEAKVSTSLFMTGLSASDVNEDADVRAALKAAIISLGGYDDVSNIVAEHVDPAAAPGHRSHLKINFVAIIYADNVEAAAALAAAATAKIVAAVESDEFLPELKAQAAEVSVSVTIIFEAAGVDEEKTKDAFAAATVTVEVPDETDDDDDEPRAEYMTFDDGGGNKSPEAPGSDMGDDDDDDVPPRRGGRRRPSQAIIGEIAGPRCVVNAPPSRVDAP